MARFINPNGSDSIENERFIKTITDNLPAMISYWTADLHCLYANKVLREWFEKTPDEMQGIHKQDLMDKEEYLQYQPYIRNVLKGEPQSFERSFFKVNGKTIYTHTQYIPDVQEGNVKGFYSLTYDYSEVRSAELEVLKKTAQIEDLLENITDGFIALDEDMYYIHANRHIGKILGIAPESLIGHQIWKLFPDVVGSATYQAIQTASLEKRYVCNEDYYAPLDLWQENRIYPTGNGLSIFIRDISDKKNEELQKALLSEISLSFNGDAELHETLGKVLEQLADFGDFSMAEAWLIGSDKKEISRIAKFSRKDKMDIFFKETTGIKTFEKGIGLPGIVWEAKTTQFWPNADEEKVFIRKTAAKKAGLKSVYGLPLFYNREITGALIFGLTSSNDRGAAFKKILESIGAHLGAEIKRKQLEQELNQVFNFTPDILCIANTNGYFKKVNPAMSILLEYSEEELLSKPFMEIVHPLDKENTFTELQNIINGKPTYYIENRYITKSGKIKWLAWTTTGASEQGILYCSAKDITEKKDLETLLHKATTLARIGGWEVDLVKGTVYWSAMTKEIHQVPADFEPDLERGLDFYKEGESRILISQFLSEAITKGTSWDVELQIITAKGNIKWIRVIGEPEFSEHKCIRIIGSFQEIDARKKAEMAAIGALEEKNIILESLQKHAKELAISNAELEQFAYVASHDLQEPLRMVTSFLTQIEKKYGAIIDDKGKQYIHFAVDGAKRMRQIILDLLEFSRVGRLEDSIEVVNTSKVINDILALYRKQIEEQNAQIIFDNLPLLKTFKVPVRQVFQNLISNALKYQKTGVAPIITISCEEMDTYWEFSVKDNGIGIDPEYFDKIFIIFQRLHNKDEYSGTGMGLAVTKKIIENLGGTIGLESEEGKGSTFYFTILKHIL